MTDTPDFTAAREGLARRLREGGIRDDRAERMGLAVPIEDTSDAGLDATAERILGQSGPEEFTDGSAAQQRQYLRSLKRSLIAERDKTAKRGTATLDERLARRAGVSDLDHRLGSRRIP